jgi:dUTP pyrophosphatase
MVVSRTIPKFEMARLGRSARILSFSTELLRTLWVVWYHAILIASIPQLQWSSAAIIPVAPARILTFVFLSLFSTMTALSLSAFYERLPLQVKKLSDKAILPTRGSDFAAGLDLSAAEPMTIRAGCRALIKTDLAIACPPGTYARVAPRSGLAYKHGIDVGAGVIDADYRGPLGVILFNFGEKDFQVNHGDRIAQLILEQIILPEVQDCQGELPAIGDRGAAGFGSTGVALPPVGPIVDEDEPPFTKQRTISPNASEEQDTNDMQ